VALLSTDHDSIRSSEKPMVHKVDCWRRNGETLVRFAQEMRKGKTLEINFFFYLDLRRAGRCLYHSFCLSSQKPAWRISRKNKEKNHLMITVSKLWPLKEGYFHG